MNSLFTCICMNRACIAMSMSLHKTTFGFMCCHLELGEKEGDELKHNFDVVEIIRSIQFQRICINPIHGIPERILDHDRVIWLGDLNCRVTSRYAETRTLLEENDRDALLEKDQSFC